MACTLSSPRFRAVLLDRDGVINDNPKGYVYTWDRFVFLPGVLDALARLRATGIRVAVITNQSAIGRGLVAQEDVAAIHDRLCEVVEQHGGRIEGVFMCPHVPDEGCGCRKPKPGSLQRALEELGVLAEECCFVGDHGTDVLAAHNAGMLGYLVRSGAPFDEQEMLEHPYFADGVFDDVADFADCLLTAR